MTVSDAVKKYGLENYEKSYTNIYGNVLLINLDKLAQTNVKDIYINIIAKSATITLLPDKD